MKNVTRRSALGMVVAAGGATFLAACGAQPQATSGSASESASGSASAAASASKSVRSDYSGVAVLDGYTSKPADYQPGTRTEPSKNAPVPVKPAVANENSVEGFYQSIAFFAAASEYYVRTGKSEPLREAGVDQSKMQDVYNPKAGSAGDLIQKGEAWMHDPSSTLTLLTPQPTRDGDVYEWKAQLTMSNGEFLVYKGQVQEISEKARKFTTDITLRGIYKNGAWELLESPVASSDSASATASSSAS